MVDGFIKNKNNKPDYLESGYKHALKGANVITELIKANPPNPLFQAWEKISENPLANPNSFTGSQREDYLAIKHLFLNSDKAGKIIREHNMQPQLSPKQEKFLEKSEVDITRPLTKNASFEEYNDYAFAALLSDDDDKMHAALDSLLTSDIGRSTQQEAAALYERQERGGNRATGTDAARCARDADDAQLGGKYERFGTENRPSGSNVLTLAG